MIEPPRRRVGLVGAAGAGKTTLATALSQEWNVPVLTENLREIITRLYAIGNAPKEEVADRIKDFLEHTQLWLKIRAESLTSLPSFIADRTAFDILEIYLNSKIGRRDDGFTASLIKQCQNQLEAHDLVIVLPIDLFSFNKDLNDAGLKRQRYLADKIFSQAIKIGMLELLTPTKKIYIPSECSTVQERLEFIKKTLSNQNY